MICMICVQCGAGLSENDHACPDCGRAPPNAISPSHYRSDSMEAIHVIEAFKLNFNLGNACKYLLRAGKKGDAKEDLEKAINYLTREMTGKWK